MKSSNNLAPVSARRGPVAQYSEASIIVNTRTVCFGYDHEATKTAALLPIKEPRSLAGLALKPPAVFLPNEKAGERFFGFFTARIGLFVETTSQQ
jgi:hypothetical protein